MIEHSLRTHRRKSWRSRALGMITTVTQWTKACSEHSSAMTMWLLQTGPLTWAGPPTTAHLTWLQGHRSPLVSRPLLFYVFLAPDVLLLSPSPHPQFPRCCLIWCSQHWVSVLLFGHSVHSTPSSMVFWPLRMLTWLVSGAQPTLASLAGISATPVPASHGGRQKGGQVGEQAVDTLRSLAQKLKKTKQNQKPST